MNLPILNDDAAVIAADIRHLIEGSRQRAAVLVNAELSQLYWRIGERLRKENLQGARAEYGKHAVAAVSRELTARYGKGWSERLLWLCLQFAASFPDPDILHTVCAELSWSHLRLLIGMDDRLKRDFYLEKHERMEGENAPIGLILCTGKNQEHVELMQLEQSNIRVSEYLTQLPPREVLEERLHRSIEMARHRLALQEET